MLEVRKILKCEFSGPQYLNGNQSYKRYFAAAGEQKDYKMSPKGFWFET